MRLIPTPYRILALVLLLLAGIGFGYVQGLSRESDRRDAQALEQTRAGIKAADKESTRREAVGAAREVSREKIRVVYRTLKEQSHEIPVNADCGLDADGLRLWNAANSGGAAPLSGEPDYTLPVSATGTLGRAARLTGQPHRGDGVVHAMPGSDGEAGGVRP